jgi:CS domain
MKIEEVEEQVKVKETTQEQVEEVKNDVKLEPIENGYEYDNYKWTQNAKDVSLYIPIDSNIKSKDLIIKFQPNHLLVSVKNQPPIFDGELFSTIKAENCTWLISNDTRRELIVELDKKKFDEWWGSVFKGERELDMSKIRPPTANITDLDSATRATIDKMLYDQDQKEKQGYYKDLK